MRAEPNRDLSVPVLVLGAEGMLGQTCMSVLAAHPGWRVTGTQWRDPALPAFFDARDRATWNILETGKYEYVINCIGILKATLNDPDSILQAIQVNALFPHLLAGAAAAHGGKVIHISSDAVFSGLTAEMYFEDDVLDCGDSYGMSKALGECPAENVLNVRCSIVGRDQLSHKGLVEWFLGLPAGAAITGFHDYCWTAVTTRQFACLCERIIESGGFDALRRTSSVYHFAPNPALSKYEFLELLKRGTGKRVDVAAGVSKSGPVRRVLSTRFAELPEFCPEQRGWPDLIQELIA